MPDLQLSNAAAALLLRLLADPRSHSSLARADWDLVVRIGRASRLLGTLRQRLDEQGALGDVPLEVRNHLESEAAVARYRTQMARRDTHELGAALERLGAPIVLLKGAAYIAQDLRMAAGRMVSDVDLMVPRERLADVEARLVEAGWEPTEVDAYDERYYREWSHEVPPMRYPGNVLELDLHHGILPPISRVTADSAELFAASRPIAGSMFRVLAPEDQVLHACVHVFVDSDLADRVRDVVDLDALLREFATQPPFWDRLCRRALELGLARALWYGLRYASLLLATPVPPRAWSLLAAAAPGGWVRRIMDALVANSLAPRPIDHAPSLAVRVARTLALLRYLYIRMPLPILLHHAVVKSARLLRPAPSSAS